MNAPLDMHSHVAVAGRKCEPHTAARGYDERLLEWLRLRARGISANTIGNAYGVSAAQVRAHTNLVLNADLAESGEHRSRVLPAYRQVAL